MKMKNVSAGEAVFIGDSGIDIETGRNAGVETVVLAHGFGTPDEIQSAGKDAIFSGFHELLDEAKKRGW